MVGGLFFVVRKARRVVAPFEFQCCSGRSLDARPQNLGSQARRKIQKVGTDPWEVVIFDQAHMQF